MTARQFDCDCILCGGCADICPVGCIEFNTINDIPHARQILSSSEIRDFVIIITKDEKRCIGCGLCVAQCPVGAIEVDDEQIPSNIHPILGQDNTPSSVDGESNFVCE